MDCKRLDEIQRRADKAHPGPWIYEQMEGRIENENGDRRELWWDYFHDDVFTANARTDVPDLVAEVRQLQAENERLHRIANYVGGSPHPIPWDQLQQRYIDEIEQLKLAKAELVEVLEGVKERLDYLVDLWGNEGVTNRVVQSINAALAKHGGTE